MLTGERIVGVIPTARTKTGLFSKKIYTLVVTDRRMILAEMTKRCSSATRTARGVEQRIRPRSAGRGRLTAAPVPGVTCEAHTRLISGPTARARRNATQVGAGSRWRARHDRLDGPPAQRD
jgi:hypothetical protein